MISREHHERLGGLGVKGGAEVCSFQLSYIEQCPSEREGWM